MRPPVFERDGFATPGEENGAEEKGPEGIARARRAHRVLVFAWGSRGQKTREAEVLGRVELWFVHFGVGPGDILEVYFAACAI